ncbi:MAG TPA: hypothetical protein DGG94_03015 [Micromonosporaceae bacterium]|nr:hypothetical protein [Micromonosporaceae bacterium]HCU48788.1 hypothetical protein [Micromonosporaceae bacterium]
MATDLAASSGKGAGYAIHIHIPGQRMVTYHRGAALLEHPVPITSRTVFNVGSVAKQITAHLAVSQVDALPLDRAVSDILPRFQIRDVTLRDLICHHGGVRDAESMLALAGLRDLDHYTSQDLLALAYRQTARAVPRGQFLYSNTGYVLLTAAIEAAHGSDIQSLSSELIFRRLNMKQTVFKRDASQVIPGSCRAYRRCHGQDAALSRPVSIAGPGALWTSATDLERWLAYVSDCWPASAEHHAFGDAVPYLASDREAGHYGAGLYTAASNPRVVVHHGHEHGFSASTYLTQGGAYVICLSNNGNLNAAIISEKLVAALATGTDSLDMLVDTDGFGQLVKGPTLDHSPIQPMSQHQWLGDFESVDVPGTIRITYADGVVHLWRKGTGYRLYPGSSGGSRHFGPGFHLVAGADSLRVGFILNMDRAPGLEYKPITAANHPWPPQRTSSD